MTNITNNTTLNLKPLLGAGAAVTFNVSGSGIINYAPTIGLGAGINFNVGSLGTLSLGPTVGINALGTINFSSTAATGGTLILNESLILANIVTSIGGFVLHDMTRVSVSTTIDHASYESGAVHLFDAAGQEIGSPLQVGLDSDVGAGNISLVSLGNGSFDVVACYLRGT